MRIMMNHLNYILATCLLLITCSVKALTITATCHSISGSRVDYFVQNFADKKNNIFIESPDSITDSQLKISWKEGGKEAILSIDDAPSDIKHTSSAKMVVMFSNDQQTTFVGILNNAPIMVTIYPLSNAAVISMQSNWGTVAMGVRAHLFHSVCSINSEK
jgi:hypothetical protein